MISSLTKKGNYFFNKSDLIDKNKLLKKIEKFKKVIKKNLIFSLIQKRDIIKLKKVLIKNAN